MNYIECKDLSFAFEGMEVATGLNFCVEEDDYLCIVGENGAGKSTLIRGMLGLVSPISGTIELQNGLKRSDIGYLPQQAPSQRDFPALVEEIVFSGCLNRLGWWPFYTKETEEIAMERMRMLNIEHLRKKPYRDLSGGQRQRVLLARALCAAGRVLLLDEPVAGLDPVATQELYSLLSRINRERHIAIVMVSHDINAAVRYAKHILHLRGTQCFWGSAADYVKSAAGTRFLAFGGVGE